MSNEFKIERQRSGWSKDIFSEAVIASGASRRLYLSGIGAEDEETGSIRHLGDFSGQCAYMHEKLMALLKRNGAQLNNVVKVVAYLTDVRHKAEYSRYRRSVWQPHILPAHTFLVISALAHPGMLIEIDALAEVPLV